MSFLNLFPSVENPINPKNKDEMLVNLCKNFVKKYVAIVTVKTPTNAVPITIRDIRVTFMDQIGIIGGTLGVFTGVSMLSLLDAVVFLYRNFKKCKNHCKSQEDHESVTTNSSEVEPTTVSNLEEIQKLKKENEIFKEVLEGTQKS